MKTLTHNSPLKRKKGLRRTPSSPLKKAKKAADIAFSKYIRARDQACQLEGLDRIRCGGVLQCMHLVTRGVYGLRYDEINAMGGCQGHHVYYTNHPEEWYLLLERKFKDKYDYVMEWKNDEIPRFKLSDYQELARYYTNKLEEL